MDTTSIKNLESEKATNKCLHSMFSSVSHELRTPINAFSNSIELIKMSIEKLKSEISTNNVQLEPISQNKFTNIFKSTEKYLKIGKISSTILLSLTEDFLDMAKMEAGTFSSNERWFNVLSLLDEIDYIFRMQWEQKGLQLDISYENQIVDNLFYSDSDRIKQILMNLLSNALKFTFEGRISIRVGLETRTGRDKIKHRFLKFMVKDTGVGIEKSACKNLFKMFGTIDKFKQQLNSKGTGLGLVISKKLTEMLGGEINIL